MSKKKIWKKPMFNQLSVNLTKGKQTPSNVESGKGKKGTYIS